MSAPRVHITSGMAWGDRHDRDDLTPALLCFIAGAVMFVVVLAACGVLP